jgi:hypothetical protein
LLTVLIDGMQLALRLTSLDDIDCPRFLRGGVGPLMASHLDVGTHLIVSLRPMTGRAPSHRCSACKDQIKEPRRDRVLQPSSRLRERRHLDDIPKQELLVRARSSSSAHDLAESLSEQRDISRSGAGLVAAAQAQNPHPQRRPRLTVAREQRNPRAPCGSVDCPSADGDTASPFSMHAQPR